MLPGSRRREILLRAGEPRIVLHRGDQFRVVGASRPLQNRERLVEGVRGFREAFLAHMVGGHLLAESGPVAR